MSLTDTSFTKIPTDELRLSILTANDAVFSDVHANLEALVAVLIDIDEQGVERIVSEGDLVGYGADPVACIDLIRGLAGDYPIPKGTRRQVEAEFPGFLDSAYARLKENIKEVITTKGNHEEGIITGPYGFNHVAREAIDWTKGQLKPKKWFQKYFPWLSEVAKRWEYFSETEGKKLMHENGRILYVHGSPAEPIEDYIMPNDAKDELFGFMTPTLANAFKNMNSNILCFVGHSHMPLIVDTTGNTYGLSEPLDLLEMPKKRKVLVNVGSVGQPRDGDNRACYALLVQGVLSFRRVPYNIGRAAEKIRAVSALDNRLADRLYSAE